MGCFWSTSDDPSSARQPVEPSEGSAFLPKRLPDTTTTRGESRRPPDRGLGYTLLPTRVETGDGDVGSPPPAPLLLEPTIYVDEQGVVVHI